jgi:hypothetical protein
VHLARNFLGEFTVAIFVEVFHVCLVGRDC